MYLREHVHSVGIIKIMYYTCVEIMYAKIWQYMLQILFKWATLIPLVLWFTELLSSDKTENSSPIDNWTLRTIYFKILVFAAIEYLPSDFFLLNS